MRFALDLVFLDREGRALAVRRRVRPGRLVWCRGARAVLEIPSPAGESPRAAGLDGHAAAEGRDRQRRRLRGRRVTLDLLCDHLAADRFGVLPAPSASDALRLCRYNHPDLLLLDLSLPDASGLDVLREIREADGIDSRFDPRLPVIVLTGRGADTDRVRGLESGADDYMTKPFGYPELRARIGAVLRRRSGLHDGPVRVGDLVVDPARRKVMVGDREVPLAKKEFSLLRMLASDPTRVFSKEELLNAIWA